MWVDYRGRSVLVTGGTRGIGLATALAFARRGARVTVTHHWSSADPDEVADRFARCDAEPPEIVHADAAHPDDAALAVERAAARGPLTAIVSNVALAPPVASLDDLVLRNLHRTVDATAWPLVTHLLAAREQRQLPRYLVGVTSAGAETLHPRYDFAACGKAVLETLVRYLAHRLWPDGVRVNAVRARFVDTPAQRAVCGEAFPDFVAARHPELLVDPQLVGDAVYGVCSGLMDGMTGQILTVDRGAGFADTLANLYRRDKTPHRRTAP